MQRIYNDYMDSSEQLEIDSFSFGKTEFIGFTFHNEEFSLNRINISKEDSVDLAMNILNHWFPKSAYINKYKQSLMKMSKEDIIKFEEILEAKDYGNN